MTDYLMPISPDVLRLFDRIVNTMVEQFGISRGEAVARINAKWDGFSFLGDDGKLLTHEGNYFWALEIYYDDVPDWSPDADRSSWNPLPPPEDPRFWTAGP